MSLYVIGDLHLAISNPEKTMEIFEGWKNYHELIEKNWNECVKPEDTVVIAGDISWGMSLEGSKKDFEFLHKLPGKKILLKGNHDYWWTTMRKMENFFQNEGMDSINILFNNHYEYDGYGICGTRGWVNMPDEPFDAKILAREANRLELSIKSALDSGLEPIVFLHYPPIFAQNFNYDIIEVLFKYNIKKCYYGHVHGKGHSLGVKGLYDDVRYHMISGDYLHFIPEKVL